MRSCGASNERARPTGRRQGWKGDEALSEQRWLAERLSRIAAALKREFGTPEITSAEGDQRRRPLDQLVRVILSQNTSDINSSRAWESLLNAFPSWEDALAAGPAAIEGAIRQGGLAAQKARFIHGALERLKAERGALDMDFVCGMTDDDALDYLGEFDGVGPKSAAIVLMFACGRDLCPVDTHVHRIARRLGLVRERASAEPTFHVLRAAMPAGEAAALHVNLLRFGKSRCAARAPRCEGCPFLDICLYEQ